MRSRMRDRWARLGLGKPGLLMMLAVATVVYGLLSVELLPDNGTAEALPHYAARGGRACDNCHVDPEGWTNPPLPQRKCSLSCLGCHINPTGGGPRTVSGRYYGQATLPMFLPSYRPEHDQHRLFTSLRRTPEPRRNRVPDPAVGHLPFATPRMAFDQERYGGLNADPILLGGIDLRLGVWAFDGGALIFPMQLDTHLVVHPLPYFTAHVTAGVLAKSLGFASTFDLTCDAGVDSEDCLNRAQGTFFAVKDVSFMLHQLPYMSYFRVGHFLPPFGTMFDDHTVAVRREFELDHGLLNSRVTGAEFGMAPNYPYLHVAVFRPNQQDQFLDSPEVETPDALPPFLGVPGIGFATSFGYREVGYQFGMSLMSRSRELADGGDTESLALSVGFNPWYYWGWLPLTYIGELAMGYRQRQGSGETTAQIAMLHEIDYLAFNGVNFRFRYEYSDYDVEVAGDHYHRFSAGLDVVLLPGLEVTAMYRFRLNETPRDNNNDVIVTIRGWY